MTVVLISNFSKPFENSVFLSVFSSLEILSGAIAMLVKRRYHPLRIQVFVLL
jgi:hypothetical protein